MTIRPWFWWVLAIWVFTGLPFFLITWGFSGNPMASLEDVMRFFRAPYMRENPDYLGSSIRSLIMLAPVMALPFAIRRRP